MGTFLVLLFNTVLFVVLEHPSIFVTLAVLCIASSCCTNRRGGGGRGVYSFDACLSHLTIDHAFFSRQRVRVVVCTGPLIADC